jgi:hypothetical protein
MRNSRMDYQLNDSLVNPNPKPSLNYLGMQVCLSSIKGHSLPKSYPSIYAKNTQHWVFFFA